MLDAWCLVLDMGRILGGGSVRSRHGDVAARPGSRGRGPGNARIRSGDPLSGGDTAAPARLLLPSPDRGLPKLLKDILELGAMHLRGREGAYACVGVKVIAYLVVSMMRQNLRRLGRFRNVTISRLVRLCPKFVDVTNSQKSASTSEGGLNFQVKQVRNFVKKLVVLTGIKKKG